MEGGKMEREFFLLLAVVATASGVLVVVAPFIGEYSGKRVFYVLNRI